MNRYAFVLTIALVAALGLGFLARAPRPHATSAAVGAAAVPTDSLTITFQDGATRPEAASVAVGRRVALTIVNLGTRSITVSLAGYEDRVPAAPLAPGASRSCAFVADRPGEAFAFLVDDEPCGRLAVTGSHLPEGHR